MKGENVKMYKTNIVIEITMGFFIITVVICMIFCVLYEIKENKITESLAALSGFLTVISLVGMLLAIVCSVVLSLICTFKGTKEPITYYDIELPITTEVRDTVVVNDKEMHIYEIVYTNNEAKAGIYEFKYIWNNFYTESDPVAYIYDKYKE